MATKPKIETRFMVLVTARDPVLTTHHEFEVRHPRRADTAAGVERKRRADWMAAHGNSDDGYVPSRRFPCRGTLRLTDRDGPAWTVQCDECGSRWGAARIRMDTELLIRNRLSAAQLPMDLAVRPYDKHPGNDAARAVARVLVERWGTDLQPHPPMLVGATGIGKTHLLAQAAHELVRRKLCQVRYWSAPDLLAAARRHMDSTEGADAFIDRQSAVELLVLDDLGAENATPWAQDVLLRVLDRRERDGLPLMGATNVHVDSWADVFGDRLASRLRGATAVVEMTGEDYRTRAHADPAGIVLAFPGKTPDDPGPNA